jgi:hypothetical protein
MPEEAMHMHGGHMSHHGDAEPHSQPAKASDATPPSGEEHGPHHEH